MLAMAFARHGDVGVIEQMDLPAPDPDVKEVRVRVRACALNHLDIWMRQGLPYQIPMPHISGCDTAGTIEKVGSGVRGWEPGRAVVIAPGLRCGHCGECLAARDSQCREFKIFGLQTQGGLAEFAVCNASDLIAIDDSWSFSEWAAIPLVFMTAWNMLHRCARVKPGDRVLVQSAGSGVGSAAIQIARLAGAEVIATAGSDEKLQLALELGADQAINYTGGELAEQVRERTKGNGVDIVVEHVGRSLWKDSLKVLRRGGHLVTCGATTGPDVEIDLRALFTKQLRISGAYMGARADLLRVLELVRERRLRPVIDTEMPLTQAAAAQERLAQRQQFGKIVLVP